MHNRVWFYPVTSKQTLRRFITSRVTRAPAQEPSARAIQCSNNSGTSGNMQSELNSKAGPKGLLTRTRLAKYADRFFRVSQSARQKYIIRQNVADNPSSENKRDWRTASVSRTNSFRDHWWTETLDGSLTGGDCFGTYQILENSLWQSRITLGSAGTEALLEDSDSSEEMNCFGSGRKKVNRSISLYEPVKGAKMVFDTEK